MEETSTLTSSRLFYIDWLRIIAFGVLIITNCAEVFAGQHWWIANTETNQTIADIIVFFRQWRMPLLFIISGLAVSIILRKKNILEFIDDRCMRIVVPLISGMLLVIPPMIFFIWKAKGATIPLLDFYLTLFEFKWFPAGSFHWMHLWYLAFVFIFSMAVLPLIKLSKHEKVKPVIYEISLFISRPAVLFSSVLLFHFPYFISDIFIPNTDLSSLIYYFPYFFFGVLFFTNKPINEAIVQNRNTALIGGIIFSSILYWFVWLQNEPPTSPFGSSLETLFQGPVRLWLLSLNQWFWVIAIAGYAPHYLTSGSKFLSYANRLVYPFYILHQTVIIIIAYYLVPLEASILIKFCLLLTGTILSILIIYELLLKRFTILKLMFGIKTNIRLIETFPKSFIKKLVPQLNQNKRNPLDVS